MGESLEYDWQANSKPCVNSGFCCTKAPCEYGEFNEQKTACKYLTVPNEIGQRMCGRYDWIVANTTDKGEMYPAFGAGCCMPLGNVARVNIIKKLLMVK